MQRSYWQFCDIIKYEFIQPKSIDFVQIEPSKFKSTLVKWQDQTIRRRANIFLYNIELMFGHALYDKRN